MKRKRKLAAAFMTALAISLAGGITVSAAEPVYTQEELTGGEEDEDGEQTFTMPVIVNATAHSEKKEDDDKGGDDGKKDEGENSGDGSTPPAQPAADAGKQTFEDLSHITESYLSTQLERGFSSLDFYKSLQPL